jgi:hypothetical protein
LDAAPDLAAWRNLHANEHLKTAAYDNEYESQGLWCAASVADVALPGGVKMTQLAFFYAPPGKPGVALPARQNTGLVQQCRLLAPTPAFEGLTTSSRLSGSGAALSWAWRRSGRIRPRGHPYYP